MFDFYFNPFAVPPAISLLIILMVFGITLSKGKISKVKTLFCALCLSLIVWLIGFIFMYLSRNPKNALFWARMGFLGISFIPTIAYHFVVTYVNKQKRIFTFALYIFSSVATLLAFTPLVYLNVKKHFWGYYPTAGQGYIIFLLSFGFLFTWAIILLGQEVFNAKREGSSLRKQQVKYLLLGYLSGASGLVDYLIKYKLPIELYPWGYISAGSFGLIVCYAIVKYRLMDIELAFREILVFASYFFLLLFIVLPVIVMAHKSILVMLLLAVGIIIVAPFLKSYIDRHIRGLVDIYIFRGKFAYLKRVEELINKLLLIPEEKQLVSTVVSKLKAIYNVNSIGVFVYDPVSFNYVPKCSIGLEGFRDGFLSKNSKMVKLLNSDKNPFVLDEIQQVLPEKTYSQLKEELDPLNAELCIGGRLKEELRVIITMGAKPKGEIYNHLDIELLFLLANQLAVALDYKRVEEELRKEEELMSIAIMSLELGHELRNLFTPILNFIDLCPNMIKDMDSFEEFRKLALDRMNVVLDKLDDINYFGSVEVPSFRQKVDVGEIIDRVIEENAYSIKSRRIEVRKSYSKCAQITGEKGPLTHLFKNIIRNGIEAIEGGGVLEVVLRQADGPDPEMKARSDEWIEVVVKDTGRGIPDYVKEKLFTPFVTTKSVGTLKREGMGLGLAIVKKVINIHCGRIDVRSAEGKGTEVILQLPVELKKEWQDRVIEECKERATFLKRHIGEHKGGHLV